MAPEQSPGMAQDPGCRRVALGPGAGQPTAAGVRWGLGLLRALLNPHV